MDRPDSETQAPPRDTVATLLRLEGEDALPLLHRVSTQSLEDLAPGGVRMTLFCDFRGRLLHRAAVAVTADRAVWLLRDDAPGGDLLAFVDRHVFREDVRLEEVALGRSVRDAESGVGLEAGFFREKDGAPFELQLDDDFGWRVGIGPPHPDPGAVERRRIHAGRPRHGHEVSEAFDPFEVGLAREVHLSKGCFTGQEALMRMVTYRGARRGLARVTGRGAPPATPREIRRGIAAKAGVLTSSVADGNGWIGLAVLALAPASDAEPLTIDAAAIEAQIFPVTRPLGLPDPTPSGDARQTG